jgi:hypothetical protein
LEVAGEALDVRAAGLEQAQQVNWRRSSSYASRVRPLYPAKNPANASRSVLVNTGAVETRAADGVVVVIRHLRDRAETRRLGQPWPQQMEPTVRRPRRSRQVTIRALARAHPPAQQSLPSADSGAVLPCAAHRIVCRSVVP